VLPIRSTCRRSASRRRLLTRGAKVTAGDPARDEDDEDHNDKPDRNQVGIHSDTNTGAPPARNELK